LTLAILDIQLAERHQVEGPVPGGEPGELPFVRHRHNVVDVDMRPVAVAPSEATARWFGLRRIAFQPLGDVIGEELLGPQDARVGLALDAAQILVLHIALQLGIKSVCL
jgi:hypothetical protein